MSPRPLAAYAFAAIAVTALLVPPALTALGLLALVTATVVDALAARRPPEVARTLPRLLSRGVASPFSVELPDGRTRRVRIRQPSVPDIAVTPSVADDRPLTFRLTLPLRRRHWARLPGAGAWSWSPSSPRP